MGNQSTACCQSARTPCGLIGSNVPMSPTPGMASERHGTSILHPVSGARASRIGLSHAAARNSRRSGSTQTSLVHLPADRTRISSPSRNAVFNPWFLVPIAEAVLRPSFELPTDWAVLGISIAAIRRFWAAAFLLCSIHREAIIVLQGGRAHGPEIVPVLQRTMWLFRLRVLADLDLPTAKTLLELHTLDRSLAEPDVALTPFVPVYNDWLVIAPSGILTARLERNFYAHLSYHRGDVLSAGSDVLESELARRLISASEHKPWASRRGCQVATSVGSSDLDFVLWSSTGRVVISVELKWMNELADPKDAFNRIGQVRHALEKQMPVHRAAFSECPSRVCPALSESTGAWKHLSVVSVRGLGAVEFLDEGEDYVVGFDELEDALVHAESLERVFSWIERREYLPEAPTNYQVRRTIHKLPPADVDLVLPEFIFPMPDNRTAANWA